MKLDITKKFLSKHIAYTLLCAVYFLLNTSTTWSQEKNTDIVKSPNTTVISGVKYYLHTVEKGQTLFAIAKGYDFSLNDIVLENPEAINGIKPGQVLKIPFKKIKKAEPAPMVADANFTLHKTEQGQTLYSIAKMYNTTIEKLKAANPELESGLKSGQTIKIPKQQTEPVKTTTKPVKTVTVPPTITEKPRAIPKPITLIDTTFKMGPLDSITAFLIDNKRLEDSAKTVPIIYPGKTKVQYNIALFLPFHATEANEIDIDRVIKGDDQLPNKSIVALQFYEGALLAVDSLKKLKLNAKIFVYDVDDHDSLNIVNIIKKPELAQMDLMIGPLYGTSFMPIAKFAKEHSIPIVSPFTQINKILFDNLYVCKVQPSVSKQIEQMACFATDTFHTQNIILVNNGNPKEVSFYNTFKTIANKELIKKGYKAADTLKESKSLGAIESMLSSTKVNVIVLPSNNQSYVTEFISKLNTIKKGKIVLFGLSGWMNYDNLDFEYLNSLSLHIPSNNYIDYQNPATNNFTKTYFNKYKTDPGLYAYEGFDMTYYFISALQKYGSGFLNNIVTEKYKGLETNFDFMQYSSNGGFENKFVYILKYQDNKLVKAN